MRKREFLRMFLMIMGGALFWVSILRIGLPYIKDFDTIVGYPTDEQLALWAFTAFVGLFSHHYARLWIRIPVSMPSKRKRSIGYACYGVGNFLIFVSVFCLILFYVFSEKGLFYSETRAALFEFYFYIIFVILGGSLVIFGQSVGRLGVDEDADAVMAKDPRPPVLYLRSFDEEKTRGRALDVLRKYRNVYRSKDSKEGAYLFSSAPRSPILEGRRGVRRVISGSVRSMFDEQMLFANALEEIGPYIAFARPTEDYIGMDIGAAKKYVSNDDWKSVIMDWLPRCSAIVVEVGTTASLSWEMAMITRCVDPRRVLLILPWTDGEYRQFAAMASEIFPRGVPTERPKSRVMTFASDWSPYPLQRDGKLTLQEVLRPFIVQIGTLGSTPGGSLHSHCDNLKAHPSDS